MTKQYFTAVIELPSDPPSSNSIMKVLSLFNDFNGGRVTAVYAGDAITENEVFERHADAGLLRTVRSEVAAIKART